MPIKQTTTLWAIVERSPEKAGIVDHYPFARTIHLVMDNLNIHCRKTLTDYFGEQEGGYLWDRLTVHHTPTHGSWLNQAEIEISLFARQCLGRRRISRIYSRSISSHST